MTIEVSHLLKKEMQMGMDLEGTYDHFVVLQDSLQQLGLYCDSFVNLCENLDEDLHFRISRLYRF